MTTLRLINAMDYIDDRFLAEALDCKKLRARRKAAKKTITALILAVAVILPGAWGYDGAVYGPKPSTNHEVIEGSSLFHEVFLSEPSHNTPNPSPAPILGVAGVMRRATSQILD